VSERSTTLEPFQSELITGHPYRGALLSYPSTFFPRADLTNSWVPRNEGSFRLLEQTCDFLSGSVGSVRARIAFHGGSFELREATVANNQTDSAMNPARKLRKRRARLAFVERSLEVATGLERGSIASSLQPLSRICEFGKALRRTERTEGEACGHEIKTGAKSSAPTRDARTNEVIGAHSCTCEGHMRD